MNVNQRLALRVLLWGVVAIVLGGVFTEQVVSKNNLLVQAIRIVSVVARKAPM